MFPFMSLDIEPTNRCNADCYFCPRDMTPDEGLLTPELFDAALDRAVEFRPIARQASGVDFAIILCGLGEPLINKHTPEWVGRVREAGFRCTMSTNGGLLDDRRGDALLANGLQQIDINVGEIGDGYEEIYKLPWERTFENVKRFADKAKGRCAVNIVLVNHRRDAEHLAMVEQFWRDNGIDVFVKYEIINRGGSLFVDHLKTDEDEQFARATEMLTAGGSEMPPCAAPFIFPFIGYDGQYYLCCSDWQKRTPMGSVLDLPLVDVTYAKRDHVTDREVVCRSCNLDPVNQLADTLRAEADGERPEESSGDLAARLRSGGEAVGDYIEAVGPHMSADAPRTRRRIPVRST